MFLPSGKLSFFFHFIIIEIPQKIFLKNYEESLESNYSKSRSEKVSFSIMSTKKVSANFMFHCAFSKRLLKSINLIIF